MTVFGATGFLGRYIVNRLGGLSTNQSAGRNQADEKTSKARMHSDRTF